MIQQFDPFQSHNIKGFSSESNFDESVNKKIVYHYTSPKAFLSILENKQVWFTDVRYMNDKSEGKFIVKLLVEFIKKHYNDYPNFCYATNELLKGNNFEDLKDMREENIKYTDISGLKYIAQRHFLFCLSTGPDLLNMWNYYVYNNTYQGYNIGFSPVSFLKSFDVDIKDNKINSFSVNYGQIIYDYKKQEDEIMHFAAKLEEIFNKKNNALGYMMIEIRNYIETQGYFYKSKAFEAENEFRVMITIADKRVPTQKKDAQKYSGIHNKKICENVCIKNGLIVPYLSVEFPVEAIKRVTMSPITETEITKSGIKEFFRINNIPTSIPVYQSKIPIRY